MGNPTKYMAILDHMGRESSFLLPEMHSYPSPQGEGIIFLKSLSFPSFSPKCNATLPHKSSPIYMYARILPPSKCKIHTKCFPTNSYFSCYSYLFLLFISILLFLVHFFIIIIISFEFAFFPPKLGILPQSGKIIPQHLGRIIEE